MATIHNVIEVDIDDILPNPWNPNTMDDATLQRLVDEIDRVGYMDYLQVVPINDGKYRIIGGEHRYRALKELGHFGDIKVICLSDSKFEDEDLQKFLTMRLNVIKGSLNPEKFANLYNEMCDKYGTDKLQELMGFTDTDAWNQVTGGISTALHHAGVPKKDVEDFERRSSHTGSVDDLSSIVSDIFSKHGDTLDYSFMIFTFGGKEHTYLKMDERMNENLKIISDFCVKNSVDINDIINPILNDVVKDLDDVEVV